MNIIKSFNYFIILIIITIIIIISSFLSSRQKQAFLKKKYFPRGLGLVWRHRSKSNMEQCSCLPHSRVAHLT
jgi:hypothetical protein